MNTLISKIQYLNCEPGEFKEEQPRTFNELIALINHFPWDQQREKLRVSPTNPSITIQSPRHDYLKLAVYFNGKYVLYYFRNDRNLYYKSFANKEESFHYLQSFYEPAFDPVDFKSESRWFTHYAVHFITRDFRYFLTRRKTRSFLISTSALQFCFGILFLFILLIPGREKLPLIAILLISSYIFLMGGGLNLLVFFNYYRYARGKILIMSKAEDIFYFGDLNEPNRYEKKEITGVIVYQLRNRRNPLAGFALIELELKKNANLLIPNLLIDEDELLNKLANDPISYKSNGMPTIKTKRIQLAG